MHKRRMLQHVRWVYVLLLLSVVWGVAGCDQVGGGGLLSSNDTALVAFDREPGAELIGFFVADEEGLYDENSIDMEYTININTQQAINSVASGLVDFGIASSMDVAAARAQGIDVVAVASIYRYNPTVLVTIGDALVKRPRDLRGKRIAVDSLDLHTLNDQQFVYMMGRIGLTIEEMDFAASGVTIRDNLLVNGEVDVATGLSATRDVLALRQQDYDARAHPVGEYGVLVYPQVIFTTGNRIEQDSDYVERFVTATLLGYQQALEDPMAAVVTLPQNVNTAFELMVMNEQIPYIAPVDAPVGWMNLSVWERSLDILPPEDAENVSVFGCYTNEFVENAQPDADGE